MTPEWRSLFRECLGFFLHFLVATIGGVLAAFISSLLLQALYSAVGLGAVGTLYNPFLWLPAGVLGFLINRRTKHRSAIVVALFVGALLALLMWWDVSLLPRSPYSAALVQKDYGGSYWRYEFVQLFSPEDRSCGASECLGKVFFTWPFLASVAYSAGAWLGLKFPIENNSALTPNIPHV